MRLQEISIKGEIEKAWKERQEKLASALRGYPMARVEDGDNSVGSMLRRAEFTVLASFADREFLQAILPLVGSDAIIEMTDLALKIWRRIDNQAA